jgi:hypothetical protein
MWVIGFASALDTLLPQVRKKLNKIYLVQKVYLFIKNISVFWRRRQEKDGSYFAKSFVDVYSDFFILIVDFLKFKVHLDILHTRD